jgi:hypothetical protein
MADELMELMTNAKAWPFEEARRLQKN